MSGNSIDWLRNFIGSPGEGDPSSSASPPERIGKYRVLSEIGRGGTSVVYKALDPDLSRPVALKVLRDAVHPVLIERLHREATAAARLRHPNIVAIHETGTILSPDGSAIHFIAMDYVDGRNLAELSPSLTPDDRLRILLAVTNTVAFTHEQGIVHRDLKPENILVDPATRDDVAGFRWHVWLTDFGLAKIIGGEDLTRSGAVIGTPNYMSPEQVQGRSKDTGPATDVWALGVMLYEAVRGRKPFDGQTALEIYEHIVRDDPPAPLEGSSRLPTDLDTLILKTLEKDPAARYPDARALAEDLDRCLRDEPISTRPAGLGRKCWRKARKHPLSIVLTIILATLLPVALLLAAAGRAERQESLSAFQSQARVAVDAALKLRRNGANAGMREFLPALEEAYRKVLARAPDLAEPDYLMGRMYRALIEDDKALEYQEAALRKDPNFGPALYERAVLLFRKGSLESTESAAAAGVEARLRESVIRDCSRLLEHPRNGLDEAEILVARGMLAFAQGQPAEARKLLEDAARADPLLDEIWQILGRASRLGTASSIDERERKYLAEEQSYSEGLRHDKGYLPYLTRRGHMRVSRGHYMAEHGRDPTLDFNHGIDDLTEALEKDPSSFEALLWRSQGYMYRAHYKMPPGTDPLGDFKLAEKDADVLIRRPAERLTWTAWQVRGDIPYLRGRYLRTRGRDPEANFASAKGSYLKSLEISRTEGEIVSTHQNLGRLLAEWADHAWRSGQDPTHLFKEAEEHFARTAKALPNNPWALRWRATGLVSRADYQESRGADPFTDYALAEDDLARTILQQKDMTSAWKERAGLHFNRGSAWEKRGEKERAQREYSAAAQDYLEAFSFNPLLQNELGSRMKDAQRKAAELSE